MTTPDNNTATTSYLGNNSTATDAAGHATQSTVDGLGHVTSVVEDATGLKLVTNYIYDPLGDLLSVSKCSAAGSGSGQSRTFAYDGLGRQIQATNPENGNINYDYYAKATLQQRQDNNGWTTYTYDANNRLKSIVYPADGTPNVSFTYDAVGNLVQSAAGNLVVNNYTSYDADNRPLASDVQVGGQTYSFRYAYDLAGDLTQETYPSGRVLTNSYDIAMRPTTLSGSAGGTTTPYVQQAGYWPQGSVYYWQYGNNIWPVETYTANLQPYLEYSTLNNSPNSYLLYLANGWNNNGTLGGIYELYGATVPWSALSWYYQGMGYDNLNRLTSIADSSGTVSNYSRTFQYDEYGNMSLATTPGVPLSGLTPMAGTGAYNAANNRLNSSGYDTRGNMTHLGAAWMAYDAESRQTQTVDSGQTLIYLYDAAGQRVQKQIAGGATTVYVHDAFGNLAAEYNSAGVTPACVTCYLSYDHLGSVRLVTDQNAKVVARHDFLPFGEEIPNGYAGRNGNGFGATGNVAQMFTGQERDGGTAVWDYFNARHMSAVLGSFMQADPGNAGGDVMHPQSWNAYVLGNPLGMVDPSGMDPIQTNCPDCTVTVFSGSLDDITTYNYSWFYGRWGSTNSSSGGGGSVFSTTVYGKANVPTASTAPAKNGTRPCQNADPNNLDFTTPRYYGSENRTVSPYQHIMDRHVLPNSKPGTTRYVFGSDFTGVHNPAQTMTAVIKWDQLTFAKGTATQQGNGNIQFLYTIPPIKIDTGFGILTLKGIGQTLSGGWLRTNGLVVAGNCTSVVTSFPTAP